MSLSIQSESLKNKLGTLDPESLEDLRDVALLDRYLSIMETNKKSCRFVPDDALVALDMAGFVRDQLSGFQSGSRVSAARLAMALVQPARSQPVQ